MLKNANSRTTAPDVMLERDTTAYTQQIETGFPCSEFT
jgi:hypothetical protein